MLEGYVHPDFWRVAKTLERIIPRFDGGAALCVSPSGASGQGVGGDSERARFAKNPGPNQDFSRTRPAPGERYEIPRQLHVITMNVEMIM